MEVLIIGAGVAGLAAAQSLAAAGVKTHIIEAQDRIGGRILTVRESTSGVPVELGAEFIHGKPPDLLDVIREARLAIPPMANKHEYVRGGQPVRGGDLFRRVDQVFERLSDPGLPDQTFSEFLTRIGAAPEVCALALNYVEGFNAARADRISTRSLAFESQAQDAIGGDQAFRFQDGYDRLPQWLWGQCSSKAELSLNTVVESIDWRRDQVALTARGPSGESVVINASRAVITVPLAVLKLPETGRGALRFEPRPAGLDQALERLEMGHAVRVTFLLDASFWQDYPHLNDAGFIHTGNESFPTWWTTLPGPVRGLTAWAGGRKGEKVAHRSNEGIAGQAIDSLARILSGRRDTIAAQVGSWHLHNWSNDPFARGGYTYACVGGLEARKHLALPVEDTLYFAGEATDTEGHAATVHGALASGRRAARQILA